MRVWQQLHRWRELLGFFMSPGILDERMHAFVADQLSTGAAAREPGEFIENEVVSWSEAMAMCQDGRIEDAKSLVLLLQWNARR